MSLLPWMMAGGKTDWLSVLVEVEVLVEMGKRFVFESIDELILRSAKMHSLSGAVCCWSEMIGVWVVWLLLQLEIWLLVMTVRLDLVSAADGEAERAFGEIIVPPLDNSCQSMQWLLNFKFYNFHHRPDHHHRAFHCWTGQQRADEEAGNSGNSKSFSSHLHCPAHCATRQ